MFIVHAEGDLWTPCTNLEGRLAGRTPKASERRVREIPACAQIQPDWRSNRSCTHTETYRPECRPPGSLGPGLEGAATSATAPYDLAGRISQKQPAPLRTCRFRTCCRFDTGDVIHPSGVDQGENLMNSSWLEYAFSRDQMGEINPDTHRRTSTTMHFLFETWRYWLLFPGQPDPRSISADRHGDYAVG